MLKKFITISLLINLALIQNISLISLANTDEAPTQNTVLFHGKVEINDGDKPPELFTGEVEEVKKGTKLNMTVSSVISSAFHEEGDEFFAEVTSDLNTPGGILIEAGTVAHGKIKKLEHAKRLGREGYVEVDFDYLITPDGREIPIEASMTTKRSGVKSVGKVVLEDTAYTLAGGLVGGLFALKFLGLGAAVASNGYTVAGGAGIGAAIGLGYGLGRKGKETLIAPGDEIKIQIEGDFELPVMSEEALKDDELFFDGLNVKISDYRLEKDPFGEPNTITLALDINNKTKQTFSSFDMALVNEYKSVFYPSPFGNTDLWFQKIHPNSRMHGKLSFSVENPKKKHWLVFYDTTTRKPLAKVSVYNAKKRLEKEK